MTSKDKFSLLAKLLPYNVTVIYQDRPYKIISMGLLGGPHVHIKQELDSGPGLEVTVDDIKPVLYSEKQLYKFIGEELPAYEVARLAINDMDCRNNFGLKIEEGFPDHIFCTNIDDKETNKVYIFENYDVGVDMVFPEKQDVTSSVYNMHQIIDYLHSKHFSVGWPQGEYIDKAVYDTK